MTGVYKMNYRTANPAMVYSATWVRIETEAFWKRRWNAYH